MTIYVKDSYCKKRAEVRRRHEGVKGQYDDLITHREKVNQSIVVLENELLKIYGELRILEELTNEEHRLQRELQELQKVKK